VVDGDLQRLATGGLAVSEREAEDFGFAVGQQVPVTWARTGKQPLEVVAVYEENEFAGGYLVSDTTFARNVTSKDLVVVAIKAAAGTPPATSRAALEKALVDYPQIEIQDQAEFIAEQGKGIDTVLNTVTGLLLLSVLIAILGIINTLALSVVERTRELGLLRAVGLQRRQMRWMILSESVVIAVYGSLLGIAIGLAFGWALVNALSDEGITEFSVPVVRLLYVLAIGAIGGVLAALLPARRAARMDVLQAIAST
jgi:putative ABC transport system permease protein